MKAIEVKKLVKRYGGKLVLDSLDLSIEEGEFYSLMGPNGSGKTTLAAIMASIRRPDSGTVSIFGKDPHKAKQYMGYIPQENFSDPILTGRENIRYFTRMLGYSGRDTKAMVDELIDKVGLSGDADRKAGNYSGGMKKKLELATIFYPGIKLLILDEPTTGLDPLARRDFFGLIKDLKDSSTTIVLITHLGSDAEVGSRVGLINNGKIISEDSPYMLKRKHGSKSAIEVETSIKNDKIRKIIDSFNSGSELIDTEKGYKFYSDDPAEVLPKIMREVEKNGYEVIHIGAATPSLEDVFYRLTGKQVREDNK